MERTRRIIRPPAVGEVWYVRLHAEGCTPRLDTVEVLELTDLTCLVKVYRDFDSPEFSCRFETSTLKWVEFVRELPRVVEDVSCPTPLKATVPQWERQRQASLKPADPTPPPPPTSR